eukprot:g9473.t1
MASRALLDLCSLLSTSDVPFWLDAKCSAAPAVPANAQHPKKCFRRRRKLMASTARLEIKPCPGQDYSDGGPNKSKKGRITIRAGNHRDSDDDSTDHGETFEAEWPPPTADELNKAYGYLAVDIADYSSKKC